MAAEKAGPGDNPLAAEMAGPKANPQTARSDCSNSTGQDGLLARLSWALKTRLKIAPKTVAGAAIPYLASIAALLALIGIARLALGPALAPGPLPVLKSLGALASDGTLFDELGVTIKRALQGVLMAAAIGTLLGLAAGRLSKALRYMAPLVASLQACPPIVWISLAMVWAGTGSMVPIATVLASTLPLVFSNTAQGVMSLSPRLEAMSQLYGVPRLRVWRKLILPAVAPYWLAGLSTVLATAWKAAAVAEFMGSHDGVGNKLYWCYANLEMEALNAWALSLIILGLTLEALVITPLRRCAAALGARGMSS